MFGYIQTSVDALSEEEKKRYGAAYCGLCRTLKARYGWPTRFSLSYEMTYLILFLSSLYEPEETGDDFRCIVHPWTKSQYAVSKITEYAADMTILLVYHKCVDDWNDEHKHLQHQYSKWLEKHYRQAKQLWPEQADAIERGMKRLSEIETASESAPDAAANCFGEMLSHLFLYKKDHWQETLMEFGYGLGQFIYMMDAVMDCEKDRKNGNYNPVIALGRTSAEMREPLMLLIGRASQAFERLPLVQDEQLLRNVLYSGVWQQYNRMLHKQKEEVSHG